MILGKEFLLSKSNGKRETEPNDSDGSTPRISGNDNLNPDARPGQGTVSTLGKSSFWVLIKRTPFLPSTMPRLHHVQTTEVV